MHVELNTQTRADVWSINKITPDTHVYMAFQVSAKHGKCPPDAALWPFGLAINTNTPPHTLNSKKVTNKHDDTVYGACPKQSLLQSCFFCRDLSRKSGKHGKQFQPLSVPLHAHVRSALLKSNKIPSVLSARPLSGECTRSPAQTCHTEEASPIPQQSFALIFFFRFNSRSCVLSGVLLISLFVFQ